MLARDVRVFEEHDALAAAVENFERDLGVAAERSGAKAARPRALRLRADRLWRARSAIRRWSPSRCVPPKRPKNAKCSRTNSAIASFFASCAISASVCAEKSNQVSSSRSRSWPRRTRARSNHSRACARSRNERDFVDYAFALQRLAFGKYGRRVVGIEQINHRIQPARGIVADDASYQVGLGRRRAASVADGFSDSRRARGPRRARRRFGRRRKARAGVRRATPARAVPEGLKQRGAGPMTMEAACDQSDPQATCRHRSAQS